MFPSSSVYRHSIASAVPTAKSLPVEQQTRIFGDCEVMSFRKFERRGRWVRRSLEPSFPV